MAGANRGEWSEIYAFFRLLADQYLFGCDASLKRDETVRIKVVAATKGLLKGAYKNDGTSVCIAYDGQSRIESRAEMDARATRLLSAIKAAKNTKGSFHEATTETFLASIGCRKIKSPSKLKRDMDVTVVDPSSGAIPTLGFSVKSLLGAPPTLLNASKATLFQYEVAGLSEKDIGEINAIDGRRDKRSKRAQAILERNATLTFTHPKSPTFHQNLITLDDAMPTIVAELLEAAWFHEKRSLREACTWVEGRDPRGYGDNRALYGIKLRRLLRAVALGMVPNTPWHDRDDATGGYIVVRPDGDLVAFYVYNRAMFDDYLFNSTNIETPSLDRHEAMRLYQENGRTYIDLCLDIRF